MRKRLIFCLFAVVMAFVGSPIDNAVNAASRYPSMHGTDVEKSEFYGIEGYYVLCMQQWLNSQGELLVLNGKWDDATETAYQAHRSQMRSNEMPLKGIVPNLVDSKDATKSEHYGEMGLQVMRAQRMLAAKGYSLRLDAMWGPETENAYQQYQRDSKDTQDVLSVFGTSDRGGVNGSDELYDDMKYDYVTSAFDLDEAMGDDDISSSQSVSGLLAARGDVYAQQASYAFSPARFNLRGYEQWYHNTYINGVYFNGLERGSFNYSMFGGLNYATRNKAVTRNMESTDYSFGTIGTSTNVSTHASDYAAGHNLSLSASNRSYYLRLQASYASGLKENGWAYMFSFVGRTGSDWNFISSGNISLADYAGQTVNIAFKYISTASNTAKWEVKDFVVAK